LTLSSDDLNNDPVVFYDIIGFENYFKAFFTIFQVITLEGWSQLMYNYIDNGLPAVSIIFFCTLVIFGAFFALNLVLAVITDSFYVQQRELKEEKLREEEYDKSRQKDKQENEERLELEETHKDLILKVDKDSNDSI